MYTDEKIDYTNYLKDKLLERNPEKRRVMYENIKSALDAQGEHGRVFAVCYADGCALVYVNGAYYGVFDADTGAFFSGYVGDQTKKMKA